MFEVGFECRKIVSSMRFGSQDGSDIYPRFEVVERVNHCKFWIREWSFRRHPSGGLVLSWTSVSLSSALWPRAGFSASKPYRTIRGARGRCAVNSQQCGITVSPHDNISMPRAAGIMHIYMYVRIKY